MMSTVVQRVLSRWRESWRSILLAATAATVTWMLAAKLLGHQKPSFAAIAAIVCLSPGVSSRGRQALGMLVGAAVGVGIGAILQVLGAGPVLGILVSAAAAMLAAAAFDINPVQIIQAGASALLIIAAGIPLGVARLEDGFVGASVAMIISQVLLTPDPVRTVEVSVDKVLSAVRATFEALSREELELALDGALDALRAASSLADVVEGSKAMTRWTVRGRLRSKQVSEACQAVRPVAELVAVLMLVVMRARDRSQDTASFATPDFLARCKALRSADQIAGLSRQLLCVLGSRSLRNADS